MKHSVQFKTKAVNDLEQLDNAVSQRILNKIKWLSENFDLIIPERLTGSLKEFYKLRIGDWRVVYTFHHGIILVHMVGHRSEIYKG